jgi:SAM-dependent methyltransferase
MLRRLVAEIPRRPPGLLLDVGCGAGHLLAAAREVGWSVAGVDPSAEACAKAHAQYALNVRASCLEAADVAEASFDVITLVNVLDQAPDPVRLLAAARRALRPGGTLMVRVPNGDFHRAAWAAIRRMPPRLRRRARSFVIFHPISLNARALRAFLERSGFSRVHVGNAPISGSDPSVLPGAVGRSIMTCMAALAGAVAAMVAESTGGRILCAPSLLAYGEREAS